MSTFLWTISLFFDFVKTMIEQTINYSFFPACINENYENKHPKIAIGLLCACVHNLLEHEQE